MTLYRRPYEDGAAEEPLQSAEIREFFRLASPKVYDDIGRRVIFFVPGPAVKHESSLLAIHAKEVPST